MVFIFLMAGFGAAPASAGEPKLTVTFIANAGFLLSAGERSILIDALFNTGFDRFPVPSSALMSQMTTGEAPFARIDAFLATHSHGDHVYGPYVADFLKRHPETRFLSSDVVCAAVTGAGADAASVRPLALEIGDAADETVNRISIKTVRAKHRNDAGGEESNLMYLVTIGGRKVLHIGDAGVELNLPLLQSLHLDQERIDVLFLPLFELSDAATQFVKDVVKPKYVVGMHVSATTPAGLADLAKFRQIYPGGIVFEKPLDSKVF
jgi:L-ascorbate metabolism protein UlaG (beta-lactamase superfamily)